jgi:hypothetical protein
MSLTLDYLVKAVPEDVLDRLVEKRLGLVNRNYLLGSSFREVPTRPTGAGFFVMVVELEDKWYYYGACLEPMTFCFVPEHAIWHYFWIPTGGLNVSFYVKVDKVEDPPEEDNRRVSSLEHIKVVVTLLDDTNCYTMRDLRGKPLLEVAPDAQVRYHSPLEDLPSPSLRA